MSNDQSRGYVYVLRNDAMPGLLKVGFTDRSPETRASELSNSTALPQPFCMVAWWEICGTSARSIETKLHEELSSHRHRTNREFFRLEPKAAVVQIQLLLDEFLRDGLVESFAEHDVEDDLMRARASREADRRAREQESVRLEGHRVHRLVSRWNVHGSDQALKGAAEKSKRIGRLKHWQNPIVWFAAALLAALAYGSADGVFVVLFFGAWALVIGLAIGSIALVSGAFRNYRERIENERFLTSNGIYQETRRNYFASEGIQQPPRGAKDETSSHRG